MLEIETEDRLGLLYVISQTFAELSLDVSAARIVTERGAAIDSFYVCERNGRQIESAERHEAIKARLLKAISKLETPI